MHTNESVIVVRSLVPGGVAQADGRIVPGDRLLFVNGEDLSHASLDKAVTVLKAAPQGLVRLGLAKPVPVDQVSMNYLTRIYKYRSKYLKTIKSIGKIGID